MHQGTPIDDTDGCSHNSFHHYSRYKSIFGSTIDWPLDAWIYCWNQFRSSSTIYLFRNSNRIGGICRIIASGVFNGWSCYWILLWLYYCTYPRNRSDSLENCPVLAYTNLHSEIFVLVACDSLLDSIASNEG